ncbi:hypothetical protein ELQ87_25350 [Streptomyces griseoviridis]|uniref:Uncharacterized protein n=1 Tax=Streptomyces griseoviridis TaxID=45398 RepID=A0A3Q9KQS8_STRGD|nr:hypothetical protein [Streptomyces griseoviridis]AZS87195.1 hypothetical protein ELQ87_25350 [Streptomyces griseoviridis]QCN85952.1 hypothetical protein DDJ31_13925 [Streptomyces griseoviridis]
MKRPPHVNATEWAEYQQHRAEVDDLAQVADQDAQMEHDLIAAHDEYELGFSQESQPGVASAGRTPPPHRSPASSRRRNRGR